MTPFIYDRGDGRPTKRVSDAEVAHFVEVGSEMVGKCPKELAITDASIAGLVAEHGVADLDHEPQLVVDPADSLRGGKLPAAFYVLIDGVPYTTKWTNKEKRSLHGFPWARRDSAGMPRHVERKLRAVAKQTGELASFNRWMKRHGRKPMRAPR